MMQIGKYIVVEFSKKGNGAYVYESEGLRFNRHSGSFDGGTPDLRYGYYDGAVIKIIHRPQWEEWVEADLRRLGIYPDEDKRARKKPSTPHVTRVTNRQNTRSTPKLMSEDWAFPTPTLGAGAGEPVSEQHGEEATVETLRAAPHGAPFTMAELAKLLGRTPGSHIEDLRKEDGGGGRLWVIGALTNIPVSKKLVQWGFRWSGKRSGYYYPEE
ncbi:putative uncharacterized protein [Burkholderiales bacterium GJ-E10]|nr:putative uncharacterized protein [Burkholderiales bacterium GJ-E10]